MRVTGDRFDALLAGALFVACEVEVITDTVHDRGHDHWPLVANVLIVAALTLPLAWRRRAPLASLVIVVSSSLLLMSALADVQSVNFPQLVLFIAPYSVAAYGARKVALLGLAYTGLVLAAGNLIQPSGATSWVFVVVATLAPWIVGRILRSRRQAATELERTVELLTSEPDTRELLAIAEQRSRIARELQTLIADSVSAMIVQTQTAQRLLTERPDEADDAMATIEETGRLALGEMRRILGVLRHPDAGPDLAPQPGIGQLADLVERWRNTHRPITLHVEGTPGPLPASVDLGVYRILDEALTDLGDRAASVDVDLRFDATDVELTVTAVSAAPRAWPTPAMLERAALCGGEAVVELGEDGAERLAVRLPLLFDEAVA